MIKPLHTFDLGIQLGQVRSVEVNIKDEPPYVLFAYAATRNEDPWSEFLSFPEDNLKLAVYGSHGQPLWKREMGRGVIPGVWFFPFMAFDLDGDGTDEIWIAYNTDDKRPFSMLNSVLEKIDPTTGETLGQWPFPAKNTEREAMSECYRYMLSAGYVRGEPVLVTSQGTYGDMHIQAYNSDMSLRFSRVIKNEEPGPRCAHSVPVFDMNGDGIDELFWGERILSLDDGRDLVCCDREAYNGHSDVVLPFYDKNGKLFIYTCREGEDYVGCYRVVTYDAAGNIVWRAVQSTEVGYNTGHMHSGWVANVAPDYRKLAMAMKLEPLVGHFKGNVYLFDALTGEPFDYPFPVDLADTHPLDLDGDGYHEFFHRSRVSALLGKKGEMLCRVGGSLVKTGKLMGLAGEQAMVYYRNEGKVRIWGDADAVEGGVFKARHASGFHALMNKMTGSGYNELPTVSCAM